MKTEKLLQKTDDDYLNEMKKYLLELKQEGEKEPISAQEKAKKALIRTGVANPDGQIKKKIVSWE